MMLYGIRYHHQHKKAIENSVYAMKFVRSFIRTSGSGVGEKCEMRTGKLEINFALGGMK